MKKREHKAQSMVRSKTMFLMMFLLTIAWVLSVGALLIVWLTQPICPGALLGPPKFPIFLFVFIGAFIVFCFGGLYTAYRIAFSS